MKPSPDAPRRPALRYHGGKFRLAKWIIKHMPEHKIYVEPFGGAASVLLQKPRCYAEIYNDLDGEIVNLFRVLRDEHRAQKLIHLLKLTPFARNEFKLSYTPSPDPIEQARRTITRSFMGFGSAAASGQDTGFRNNANRSGTTPAHDWVNYPDKLLAIVERLQGVVVENKPAIDLIKQLDDPRALHYCDPPYPLSTRSDKRRNSPAYRHEMSDDQHRDLATCLHSVKGMVMISGYACNLYDRELYPDWDRVEKEAHADGARDRVEVLWLSPRTVEALDRPRQIGLTEMIERGLDSPDKEE